MKKVFIFEQRLMNGTVTMKTAVAIFGNRELAEKTRRAIIEHNRNNDLGGLSCAYCEIEETDVYETIDEVPFFDAMKDIK